MLQLFYFVLGILAGMGIAALSARPQARRVPDTRPIEKPSRKKEENKTKILAFVASKDRVANDDIQTLLGVSDATATRYLDELEQAGKIRQVGRAGKHVHYEKIE